MIYRNACDFYLGDTKDNDRTFYRDLVAFAGSNEVDRLIIDKTIAIKAGLRHLIYNANPGTKFIN